MNLINTTDVNLLKIKLGSSLAQFPAPSATLSPRARMFALFAEAVLNSQQTTSVRSR